MNDILMYVSLLYFEQYGCSPRLLPLTSRALYTNRMVFKFENEYDVSYSNYEVKFGLAHEANTSSDQGRKSYEVRVCWADDHVPASVLPRGNRSVREVIQH
jgi:hypothetical protein